MTQYYFIYSYDEERHYPCWVRTDVDGATVTACAFTFEDAKAELIRKIRQHREGYSVQVPNPENIEI